MLGWKIFAHAVGMVLRNLSSVVRIFWAPVLLGALIVLTAISFSGIGELIVWGETSTMPNDQGPSFFLWFLVIWLSMAIVSAWGITTWHRYVLLEEFSSGLIPELNLGRAFGYVLRLFLLGLIALVIALPVGFVLSAVVMAIAPLGLLLFSVGLVVLGVLLLRWSLILPAFAVGQPMRMSESWNAWDEIESPGRTALGLVIVYFVFQLVISAAVGALYFAPLLQTVLSIATQAFVAIVNVSILTTLYGVIVEKRALS